MKKIISLLLIVSLVMVNITSSNALEKSIENNTEEILGYFEIPVSKEGDLQTIDLVESGQVRAGLARTGNTTSVELFLIWEGDFAISAFRFTKLSVLPTSYLSSTVYARLYTGSQMVYNTSAGKYTITKIANINIPTNVNKVRIEVSALNVYSTECGWLSGILSNQTATIN